MTAPRILEVHLLLPNKILILTPGSNNSWHEKVWHIACINLQFLNKGDN